MNILKIIQQKYSTYPAIMNIEDEIEFIEELKKVPQDMILNDIPLFFEVLDIFEMSHIGGGIFEVTDDNLHIFNEFSDWLREINKKLNLEILEIIAGNLEGKFDDIK